MVASAGYGLQSVISMLQYGTYNIAYWYIQCKKIIRKWNAVLAHVKTYVGITNY